MAVTLYLASQSPRRAALLAQVGVPFQTRPVDIDETPLAGESPDDYLERMALGKAQAAQAELAAEGLALDTAVLLAADTIGELDDKILVKPRDRQHAFSMLESMAGRSHTVATGVCVLKGDKCHYLAVKTQVHMAAISAEDIRLYWDTKEPWDKAGGYAIQGYGAVFVDAIEGSYSNVVGLPLAQTISALREFGVDIWQLQQ
ncbi:MAG: Maf family protein [Cellvibrionaceae bacterium]|nr:Maf family protein [Cellvibrionaceae bacterium]